MLGEGEKVGLPGPKRKRRDTEKSFRTRFWSKDEAANIWVLRPPRVCSPCLKQEPGKKEGAS